MKLKAIKVNRTNEVLTSTWSDGRGGPLAFCVPEGRISASEIHQFNCQHVGVAYVLTSGTASHFMCAETLATVYEQPYSPALRVQRERYLVFG